MNCLRAPLFYFALALSLPAHAALKCDKGERVSVSGQVTTINLSATQQTGQICATLTNARGTRVFDQCGAIVGKLVSTRPETGSSVLNHTVLFDKSQAFTTRNDAVQITGVQAVDANGTPCAFSAVEKISQMDWAKGIFQKGSVNIVAQGTISMCPDKNLNTFTLTGEACMANTKDSDDDGDDGDDD